MKKLFAIALAVLMIAGSCMAFASCKKDGETIKIGVSGPLTGDAAVYGVAVKNAAQMAVDEINEKGGLNGIKFELIVTDDQHDANKVSTNYANMMDKGMQVSLGCVTSAPCLEFAKYSKEDNLFFLTPSASADAVPTDANAYQMCFADGNQGAVAADYVNGLGLSSIGIFSLTDDPYSKGIYDQFKANLDEGIETVEATFTKATSSDFTQQIETLKDCTFIFMPIYYTPASLFMTQAKDKIAATATYYGCDGFDGIESAEGFDINAIPQKISMLSHFNSKATEGKAKEFVDKYVAKYGKDTLNQFGAAAYDCVYALFGAMTKAIEAGKTVDANTTATEMCEILKEQFNGGYTFDGATGTGIKWKSTGFVDKTAIAYEIKPNTTPAA